MTLSQRDPSDAPALRPVRATDPARPLGRSAPAAEQAIALQLMPKEQQWRPTPIRPAERSAGAGASAAAPEWNDDALRRRIERADAAATGAQTGSRPASEAAARRARAAIDADAQLQQAQLESARRARTAAERDALSRAEALAAAEAERLAAAEAELSAAVAATREARAELERVRRVELECRQRADAQRAVTVQARMIHRTLAQRRQAAAAAYDPTASAPVDGAPATASAADTPDAAAGPTRPSRPVASDATGFAPTVPGDGAEPGPPILTLLPSDPSLRGEAANRPRMGTVLVEGQRLTPVDVEVVLMHQAEKPRRFGEIAVSLGLLEISDVVWALRRQRPHPQGDAGGALPAGSAEPLVLRDRPDSPTAAVIRDIARQLVERRAGPAPRRALGIVGVGVGEGRSTVAANLAMAMAEQGQRVLLVDTDFTRSRMKQLLPGLSASQGLGGVLAGRTLLDDAIARPVGWSPQPRELHVLPAGDSLGDPAQLARLPAFQSLLETLVERYDQVLLDTAAASQGPGALQLACRAGAALVVARPGHTRSRELDHLTASLREGGATVLGVVMNSH